MITIPQMKKLHTLLFQLNIMEDKKTLLLGFTHGRTDSAKELTIDEAKQLIDKLGKLHPSEQLKRAIWHVARLAGLIYGDSKEDNAMNAAKLDGFLRDKGVVKKPLQKMNFEELKKVHRQFEGILRNNKKSQNNRHAKAATESLLKELNLSTQK